MTVRNRSLAGLAVVLLAGLLVYTLWPSGRAEPEIVIGHAAPQADSGFQPGDQAAETEADDEPRQLARRARQLGESKQSELREIAVAREHFPHDVLMQDYKAALWADIRAHPPRLESRGDPALDGEMAYRLYMYYGNCSVVPRTGPQIDRRLGQLVERADRTSGGHLRAVENRVEQTIEMYELCSAIPADVDCRMEAVLWMSEAVRLGHEIAQVQFYEKAMGFLLRPDPVSHVPPLVMQRPDLISDFKATARLALNGAMKKGHPEAYLAMSRAVFDGVIYAKDPVAALAYARVAEFKAAEHHVILRNLEKHKFTLTRQLDQEQLAEAEELAHNMRAEAGG